MSAEGEGVKLLVISPTPNEAKAAKMVATARRVGIEPYLYGFNSNHPHGKDYQGTDIVKILQERTDAEVVMGVDSFDVAFLAGEDEIMHKFGKFQHPFVMSTERTGVGGLTKTKNELARQCSEAGGWAGQPNIGGWIGTREYALHCFDEAERLYKDHPEDPNYSYDNHYQWLAMMKAWGGAEFDLDRKCVIFQSMDQVQLQTSGTLDKRFLNPTTQTYPCILHYHGDPTRQAYDEMVRYLLS